MREGENSRYLPSALPNDHSGWGQSIAKSRKRELHPDLPLDQGTKSFVHKQKHSEVQEHVLDLDWSRNPGFQWVLCCGILALEWLLTPVPCNADPFCLSLSLI